MIPSATPSPGRSCTSCVAARPRWSGPTATTARSTRRRCSSSCSRSCGAGAATTRSCSSWSGPRAARSTGSTPSATATATASSSTCAARATASTTRTGRTPTTRWCSTTARSRARRSRRSRCRATSTTRSCAWQSSRGSVWRDEATGGAARRRRRRRCASGSTRRSGFRNAAGTRSASTPRSGRSMRSRPTWVICCGAASSPADRVAEVAAKLASGPLWSGWGVRTLAADEPAFDPLEYHNGTVWPHDNSLIALGLAQAGRRPEAERVVRALLDCAPFFEYRLPELFAGDERRAGEPPGVVPTSARPQAWAAGTPLLLLRAQLGLEPDPVARALRVTADTLPAMARGPCPRRRLRLRSALARARPRRRRDRRGPAPFSSRG